MAVPIEAVFAITMYAVGCDVKHDSLTKMGTVPTYSFTVAADPEVLPMNSIIRIKGLGDYIVHDIGGKVKGNVIDIYMNDCGVARLWGRRHRTVKILYKARGK